MDEPKYNDLVTNYAWWISKKKIPYRFRHGPFLTSTSVAATSVIATVTRIT